MQVIIVKVKSHTHIYKLVVYRTSVAALLCLALSFPVIALPWISKKNDKEGKDMLFFFVFFILSYFADNRVILSTKISLLKMFSIHLL